MFHLIVSHREFSIDQRLIRLITLTQEFGEVMTSELLRDARFFNVFESNFQRSATKILEKLVDFKM
jgi:hypothetical protein